MKTSDWLMIGALGIGAFLLYKMFSGGTGAADVTPAPVVPIYNAPPITLSPTEPTIIQQGGNTEVIPIYIPEKAPGNKAVVKPKIIYYNNQGGSLTIPAPLGTEKGITNAPSAWTNTTYGMPGQPSVNFLANTVSQGAAAKNKTTGISPVAAIAAGAPPRVVAKIKAGKIF